MEIKALKGLGPKSQAMLEAIGINNVESFMSEDPFDLYAKLKLELPGTSMNMLYAMIGAQENMHWKEVAEQRKTEILMRLDDMGLPPGK